MPCYHPIPAELQYKNGKRQMQLHPAGEPTHWLPCSKCLGCREVQQQQLALRVIHEAKQYRNNVFLTLTYDDEHDPGGLQKHHMQKFWKRLRKKTQDRIKHLTCGEYGDRTKRAHYHAAALGLAVNDQKPWDSENNRSAILEETWGMGMVTVSDLTEERVRYVAGYVLKKAGHKRQIYCDEDGVDLQPPYRDMSKGLGKQWLDKYATDLRLGYLQHDGAKYTIPRYYADRIKSNNPELHRQIETQKAKNWRELTEEDRKLLNNGEYIRSKQIREKRREQI